MDRGVCHEEHGQQKLQGMAILLACATEPRLAAVRRSRAELESERAFSPPKVAAKAVVRVVYDRAWVGVACR